MQQEIKALEKNGTWTLEELPEGKRPIDSKWVYKTKFKSNGEVERYKARLVAKGCAHREGVDYHEHLLQLVGRLLYLQAIRPDVIYAVNVLSQFVLDPRQNHLEAAKRVLRYLKGTPGQWILLPREGPTTLTTYCDSDWLGYPFTRRPEQEAEYRAMASTVSEILW
nr:hypothetical protein [Tanacetum cinerariifolium]